MDGRPQAVGPLYPRFSGIRRIAVLRGGGLGDVLFTVPALHALAQTYPEAEITLLGTPLHVGLLESRPGPVHTIEVLPYAEGVRPGPEDPDEVDAFLARMREREIDLAVQLHGGGRFSNPFLLRLGARHTIGTRTPDAAPLERSLPYVYYQHEVLRALEVVGLAGASTDCVVPLLAVTDRDLEAARPVLEDSSPGRSGPRLALHPGASDPRRRWPVEHFAMLARWAAEDGWEVLVIGDEADRALAEEVVRGALDDGLAEAARAGRREPAAAWGPDEGRRLDRVEPVSAAPGTVRSVAGQLSVRGLVGLLAGCDAMVGNDSGPRHLAQAVGTPTVGIFWIGNTVMAAPLGRAEHRIHSGWTTHCPVCGTDLTQLGWTATDCGHVVGLNDAVRPQDVYADVLDLLEARVSEGPARG